MFERFVTFLICPKTHNRLIYNNENNCYNVETKNISYPINNGIIDFVTADTSASKSSEIIKAYNKISKKYDSLITSSTLFSRLMIYLTWGDPHSTKNNCTYFKFKESVED